jgi:uncharacterized protein involved in response to NO
MSYLIFIMAEIIGLLFMLATWKGIFGLVPSFLAVLVMIALSFHVLAREPKPDGTSIRMASFSAMLWYASILCGKLMLENRGWATNLGAGAMLLITAAIAVFSTWSVLERPLDYDVDEAK